MGTEKPAASPHDASLEGVRGRMRRLERRDWWMWIAAAAIMLLLCLALFSFTLPRLWPGESAVYQEELSIAVRGLLGLVLLFMTFVFYQQMLIHRLRRALSERMSAVAALETRAGMLEKLSIIDPLTELYNRRFVTEHLPMEIARAERAGYPLTVLMLDLDELKVINDRYGHAAGDRAIYEFARHLKKGFRSSDLAVRMGGDEFMMLLPECTAELVPRVLAHLGNIEIVVSGESVPVTFSAGWAQHRPGEGALELMDRADRELYADKGARDAQGRLRDMETRLRQEQKLHTVGKVAGGLAHDFNNLLTMIRGYSGLILEQVGEESPLRDPALEIERAAERAGSLTRQLLAFSRPQVLRPRLLNLYELIAGMEMMLRSVVGPQIQLAVEPCADLGNVRCDTDQLQQVVMNLVLNARDATPAGGTITIETGNIELDDNFAKTHPGARPGAFVFLKVADTGSGIPPAILKRIFEPFFTTKEGQKGSGLGLAIVFGIVKQTASYVWVDSEVGKGTVFTIYFPRMENGATEDDELAAASSAPAQ